MLNYKAETLGVGGSTRTGVENGIFEDDTSTLSVTMIFEDWTSSC